MVLKEEAADDDALAPDEDDPREALKKKKKAAQAGKLAKRRALLKQQEAERKLPLQLGLVLLNSVGAAVVISMLVALGLRDLNTGNPLTDPEASRFVLFLSFAIGFFFALLLLVRRLPPNWWKLADEMVNTPKYTAPDAKWGGVLDPKAASKFAPLFDISRPTSGIPAPTLLQADTGEVDAFEATAAKVSTGLKSTARALDLLGKFTSQLLLAGGTGAVARKFTLSGKDAFTLLVQGQAGIGVSKVFADLFAANVEHYAQRDAYRPLIEAGQTAMDGLLRGDPDLEASIAASVNAWANDKNKRLAPKIVTFMVSDIVDADGLVARLGNLRAQRVVRAHHQAAKTAIGRHAGTEVRNGGDGALATFPDPDWAIAAAKDILTRINAHNAAQPHLSANVGIAIHAGETAADANGFVGATIVTAARMCQLARAGQILASDLIKAFCKQNAAAFTEFGSLADELVDTPRPLFEVAWVGGVEYGDIGKAPGASAG